MISYFWALQTSFALTKISKHILVCLFTYYCHCSAAPFTWMNSVRWWYCTPDAKGGGIIFATATNQSIVAMAYIQYNPQWLLCWVQGRSQTMAQIWFLLPLDTTLRPTSHGKNSFLCGLLSRGSVHQSLAERSGWMTGPCPLCLCREDADTARSALWAAGFIWTGCPFTSNCRPIWSIVCFCRIGLEVAGCKVCLHL